MNATLGCALYFVVGVACAIEVARRAGRFRPSTIASAVAALLVWPLWAPFALGAESSKPPRRRAGSHSKRQHPLSRDRRHG